MIGISVEGRPLEAFFRAGRTSETILVLGGVHGDEPKGVYVVRKLVDWLFSNPHAACETGWMLLPLVNPDGFERRRRRNARNVDINRNFPTRDWAPSPRRSRMHGGPQPASEPETRAVVRAVTDRRPAGVVTIHSIGAGRYCNNFDGPARELAAAMQRVNGYPVSDSIGYATPGSFGTWAGREQGIPTITLELPSRQSAKRCWETNQGALLALARPQTPLR